MTRSLRESVREGLVVVVSILIAFSLDAWWDVWSDRRDESEILGSLATEFAENRDRLSQDIEDVRGYVGAAQRLLSALEDPAVVLSTDSAGAYLWRTMSWRTTNFRTATLDAVVGGGRLELIRDDSLRVALAGWPSRLADSAEEEVFEWREITERYRPLVGRYVAIPSLEGEASPPAPSAAQVERLLPTTEFRSALAMRLDVSIVALNDKQRTLQELERILGLLSTRLP